MHVAVETALYKLHFVSTRRSAGSIKGSAGTLLVGVSGTVPCQVKVELGHRRDTGRHAGDSMHNPSGSLHVRQHRSNMPRLTCGASSQELDDWHACRSPPRLSVPRVLDLQVKKERSAGHG